jgi:hypothetical protein
MHDVLLEALCNPKRLLTCSEILERPSPVPQAPGIYAWYFDRCPPSVPLDACHILGGQTLLYLGISPCRSIIGKEQKRLQSIRKRVRYHTRGNAEGSTLRLSLGCLLEKDLGIELRRVGTGARMTFGPGEKRLSAWLAENASVAWVTISEPWLYESQLIRRLNLPLNIAHNAHHRFSAELSRIRRAARVRARSLPVGHQP